MQNSDDRDLSGNKPRDYERWGVDPSAHEEHGHFNPSMLEPFKASKWWVEGNMLYADGNHGKLAQRIPNDYICTGMDENGLPILEKIVV